jgi:DNA-binding NarL/FixJ family response regulator
VSASEVRVLIIADDPLVRAGLRQLLEEGEGIHVVAQISADAGIGSVEEALRPDAVVWDLGWEPADHLERLTEVSDEDLPVIALVLNEVEAADAYSAGARGLLQRDVEGGRLAASVRAVIQGLVVSDLHLSDAIPPFAEQDHPFIFEELTPRELDVLELLAEGLTNKAVAVQLEISEYTVKFHVNTILRKLGAQSRTEAAMRAARLGLITL